jgi:ATP-binding cassette subfamily B protein
MRPLRLWSLTGWWLCKATAGSFRRLRTLLEGLLASFSSTAGQALYLDDLFSFFEVEPEILSPDNPRAFPQPIREGFTFEDVGFMYPGAERWAVRHLSFTLQAGEVVALVGENGAGKTTLVKLLTRLYDPDEGRILLDGHDLREYDLDALRGNMGVIFQDFVRYNLSAADNIAVGRIAARNDRPRIERAAFRSQADEVIAKLPAGFDQMIGKRFKNGVELSGGEWQKIAIARAYMREAEVLILDEPTAALDARSEHEVFRRFKELSKGKTAVLISHRFSSVRMADRILVLADGKVEAAGTHEERSHRVGKKRRRPGSSLGGRGRREPGRKGRGWASTSLVAPLTLSVQSRNARARSLMLRGCDFGRTPSCRSALNASSAMNTYRTATLRKTSAR